MYMSDSLCCAAEMNKTLYIDILHYQLVLKKKDATSLLFSCWDSNTFGRHVIYWGRKKAMVFY